MTTKEDLDRGDVAAIHVSSAKELDAEFVTMLAVFADKESEFNWEARERSLTRLRGILRGNATEKYPDSLTAGIRHMVDGIIKAAESLRTTLALNGLTLVEDIARYFGKHIDDYTYEHILNCMIRCASVTKKLVASKSKEATVAFLSHCNYYHKTPRILGMAMGEKNHQTRLHTIVYTRAVLRAHAHCERTRSIMDRKDGTKHLNEILAKGMSDATPAVREACREPFWIFWEHWRDHGESILKALPPASRKAVENSRSTSLSTPNKQPTLRRAPSSLGSRRNVRDVHDTVSPSNSTASNGSSGSLDISKSLVHPISPRAASPSVQSTSPHHLRSYISSPPMPSQLYSSHTPAAPSPPRTPTTPTAMSQRRSRVPLTRKKSTIMKTKLGLVAMLHNDDLVLRCDGIRLLARKLLPYPYQLNPDVATITVEAHGSTTEGEKLRSIMWSMLLEDNVRLYEMLSSWEGVAGVMLKLTAFDEYVPRLMLDASDDVRLKTQEDIDKNKFAQVALRRVKYVLNRRCADLAGCVFHSLVKYGGFGGDIKTVKKEMRSPANRRTLTTQLLLWLDELVQPLLSGLGGVNEDDDEDDEDTEAKGAAEWLSGATHNVASSWFESDAHVRQCLDVLLPAVSTSMSGTVWHNPLKALTGHLRRLNQTLFDTIVMATFDAQRVNKISRELGIHIRLIPDAARITDFSNTSDIPQTTMSVSKPSVETTASLTTRDTLDDPIQSFEMESPPKEDEAALTPSDPSSPSFAPLIPVATPCNASPEPTPTPSLPSPVMTTDKLAGAVIASTTEKVPTSPSPSMVKRDAVEDMYSPVSDTTANASPPASQAMPTPIREASPPVIGGSVPPLAATAPLTQSKDVSVPVLPEDLSTKEPLVLHKDMAGQDAPTRNGEPALLDDEPVFNDGPLLHGDPPMASQTESLQSESPPARLKDLMPDAPTSIPYFAPQMVINPLPVFGQNHRTLQTNERTKDRSTQLYSLVDKMVAGRAEQGTFRKLIRLSEDAPVLKKWDQGGCNEPGSDVWAGADQDGGNFVETVQALTPFLSSDASLATSALELLQQLAVAQTGLFRFYERKVDGTGMSLEARLIERLLLLRGHKDVTMCTTAEGVLEAVLSALDPQTVLEILLAYLAHQLMGAPNETMTLWSGRYHPIGSAFTYLGKWVSEINDTRFLDEWLEQGGARVFQRGMNDDRVHVRKACVDAMVEFQEVLGDELYEVLHGLRADQLNLVRSYAAKAIKKKASVRNLSATGQIR